MNTVVVTIIGYIDSPTSVTGQEQLEIFRSDTCVSEICSPMLGKRTGGIELQSSTCCNQCYYFVINVYILRSKTNNIQEKIVAV